MILNYKLLHRQDIQDEGGEITEELWEEKHHHQMKHHPAWSNEDIPPGELMKK